MTASRPARKGLFIGLGAGAVLMAATLILLFVGNEQPPPQPPEELSALKPLPQAAQEVKLPAPTPSPQPSPAPSPPPPPRPPKGKPSASAAEEARIASEDATKLLRARDHSGALTLASRCIELVPDNAQCHLVAGTAYARTGVFEKAAQHYRKFLKLAPDHRMARRIRRLLERYEADRTGL